MTTIHDATMTTILQQTIRIYRYCTRAAMGFVALGLVIALVRDMAIGTGLGSVSTIISKAVDLHPAGFIGIGIGVIILAPIIMLTNAALTFLRSRETRYAMITAVVAGVLMLSIVIAFVKG